jgi:hypothetical protein
MIKDGVLIKKYKAPSYRTPYWVVVSSNVEMAIETLEDITDYKIASPEDRKSVDAYTFGFVDHEHVTRVIVFVTPKLKPGRIAHEAKHVVDIILHWNGVKPSFTNDEAECYFLETMVDKIHDTIKLYNKSI